MHEVFDTQGPPAGGNGISGQASRTFLPASLRPAPQTPRPRARRPIKRWIQAIAVTAVCIGAGTLPAGWRLKAVEVTSCPGLPPSAVVSLEDLRGRWIPAVNLDEIRRDVERWPGIAGVAVELKLPATLRVQALPDEICASVPMGRAWRGVTCNGRLSLRLPEPRLPVLENFGLSEAELRSGLSAGARLCDGTTGRLLSIRKITPSDYELTIADGVRPAPPSVVKVAPQGSLSEQWWHRAALTGQAPAWADLRFDQRIVIRRAG